MIVYGLIFTITGGNKVVDYLDEDVIQYELFVDVSKPAELSL